jgi:hypothetical protein
MLFLPPNGKHPQQDTAGANRYPSAYRPLWTIRIGFTSRQQGQFMASLANILIQIPR